VGRIKEKGAQPQVSAERNARKSEPRVINVDKNAAYPKAIAELKAWECFPHQLNYNKSNT
jgi:transposase-like protein